MVKKDGKQGKHRSDRALDIFLYVFSFLSCAYDKDIMHNPRTAARLCRVVLTFD